MRISKRIVCLMSAVIILLSLVACGKPSIVGKWEIDGIHGDYITFNKDGTMSILIGGQRDEGTYTVSGSKIIVTNQNSVVEEMEYTLNDDSMDLTVLGDTMGLHRVK